MVLVQCNGCSEVQAMREGYVNMTFSNITGKAWRGHLCTSCWERVLKLFKVDLTEGLKEK